MLGGETRQLMMVRRTDVSVVAYRGRTMRMRETVVVRGGGPPAGAPGWIQVPGPAGPAAAAAAPSSSPSPSAAAAVEEEPTLRGAKTAGAPVMALLPRTWIIEPTADTNVRSSDPLENH